MKTVAPCNPGDYCEKTEHIYTDLGPRQHHCMASALAVACNLPALSKGKEVMCTYPN